jgi:hypothetical protein
MNASKAMGRRQVNKFKVPIVDTTLTLSQQGNYYLLLLSECQIQIGRQASR